ncbi:hypothetical protein [Streptosporangium sp. OZ121]|uniref:hypothetical protein n=1 Tax=Streptosporangium sp. OZ121 TaxID=3444183 RepID=UPI003F79F9EA
MNAVARPSRVRTLSEESRMTMPAHALAGHQVLAADPRARRELMVQIWYPAAGAPSAPRAAYVQDDDVFVAMARLARVLDSTFGHLRHVTTNAVESAPVAAQRSRYPVLVFLEGATGFRQMNTFQVEPVSGSPARSPRSGRTPSSTPTVWRSSTGI